MAYQIAMNIDLELLTFILGNQLAYNKLQTANACWKDPNNCKLVNGFLVLALYGWIENKSKHFLIHTGNLVIIFPLTVGNNLLCVHPYA